MYPRLLFGGVLVALAHELLMLHPLLFQLTHTALQRFRLGLHLVDVEPHHRELFVQTIRVAHHWLL